MTLGRAHIVIEGRVQGVYYRASLKEAAEGLGLKGWVRNLPGGEVEAAVEGEESAIDALVEWCWKGPPHAAVDNVTVEPGPLLGDFDTFLILR
ncbi:MAG: acylphosphatase [Actinomycetota bacterium]|nr:acylphosphatase [Actinomycetota bacterium]